MHAQIRLSSLVLAALLGIGLTAGLIRFSPALTQTYYVHLGLLVLGAGVLVTVYNRCMAARARRRAEERAALSSAPQAPSDAAEMPAAPAVECGLQAEPAAYADTQAARLPVSADAPAEAAEDDLPADLDALLDIAYEAGAHDPARAVRAYRAALARYPGDSYMPYLVIELSTLYKNMGDYGAARALFAHALTLPAVAERDVMVQEFRRSVRYLDELSAMLAAEGRSACPFGEIPKALIDEANRRTDAQAPAALP